jgi:hypothetical protein
LLRVCSLLEQGIPKKSKIINTYSKNKQLPALTPFTKLPTKRQVGEFAFSLHNEDRQCENQVEECRRVHQAPQALPIGLPEKQRQRLFWKSHCGCSAFHQA